MSKDKLFRQWTAGMTDSYTPEDVWKACAAIKDAEIAVRDKYVEELREREREHLREIASRDLVIKELREAASILLVKINSNIPVIEIEEAEKKLKEALAKSEHHNYKIEQPPTKTQEQTR